MFYFLFSRTDCLHVLHCLFVFWFIFALLLLCFAACPGLIRMVSIFYGWKMSKSLNGWLVKDGLGCTRLPQLLAEAKTWPEVLHGLGSAKLTKVRRREF